MLLPRNRCALVVFDIAFRLTRFNVKDDKASELDGVRLKAFDFELKTSLHLLEVCVMGGGSLWVFAFFSLHFEATLLAWPDCTLVACRAMVICKLSSFFYDG